MTKTKEYNNGEVTVLWKPEKCIHSGICVKGLPEVFQPKERPWIKVNAADSETIINQVHQCPSGALSMKKEENKKDETIEQPMIDITVLKDGPLMVKGSLKVCKSDGTDEIIKEQAAFCRCGASDNKPFCDGSHTDINFKA